MFNDLYSEMTENSSIFIHPECELSEDKFSTTAWNAAWTAAQFTTDDEKQFLKDLTKAVR